MNVINQIEIIAPRCSIFADELAAYPNYRILEKSEIAPILHKKKVRIDCIVFTNKPKNKKEKLDPEVAGVVFIADEKFKDHLSEFASYFAVKELKNKILLLDTSCESKLIFRRIINAYKIQAPSEIIAKFEVYKEDNDEVTLQITTADFTELTINSKVISAIADMTYKELLNFELEEYGFDISWPAKDIHLNLESFKMVADKNFMKKRMRAIGKEKREFGLLMKQYRENKSKFTQKDFGELSERQIRKYENGENYPSYESLHTISSTYDMNVNEYLNALSEIKVR